MPQNLSKKFTYLELLRELEKSLKTDRIHDGNASIFLLWQDIIAKRSIRTLALRNEYNMGNFLFEKGIPVPKMYGIVELAEKNLIYGWKRDYGCLIMQRINGKTIGKTIGAERKEAIKQLKSEIEKILELGILPEDSLFRGNSIFNSKERKLYLIDFEQWKKDFSKKEIDEFNEILKNYKGPIIYD